MSTPVGVCVKVSSLRPEYSDLAAFLANPRNVLVCRRGRLWITNADGTKRLFQWQGSQFANPFPVGTGPGKYELAESLRLYRRHLERLLQVASARHAFRRLASAERLGCFCAPGTPCHRDIIIEVLRTVTNTTNQPAT